MVESQVEALGCSHRHWLRPGFLLWPKVVKLLIINEETRYKYISNTYLFIHHFHEILLVRQ